jgi:hypothetical protein
MQVTTYSTMSTTQQKHYSYNKIVYTILQLEERLTDKAQNGKVGREAW